MRSYPRKYDELPANSINVSHAPSCKKKARTSGTSREDIFKFTSASESEKLPPAAGGSAPYGAIGVEVG